MKKNVIWLLLILLILLFTSSFAFPEFLSSSVSYKKGDQIIKDAKLKTPPLPPLDILAYDLKIEELANNPTPEMPTTPPSAPLLNQGGEGGGNSSEPKSAPLNLWPVKTVYPNAGAILPFNRIVAYYGNLYSTKMGALGEYPEDEMLAKLDSEVKKWELADPGTPVIPALHYIAVVAQASPGKDGKYRFRMPDSEIDKVLHMAEKINALVFLDFQVAFSTIDKELPVYEKYFKMPNVHVGIDPEFSMKNGIRPGKVVGTYDASDINYAIDFLAKIVQENNLTPKILVVHRYTQKMVTNYSQIKTLPEVQLVMHMDGWGGAAKKINTYKQFIYPEPVQFTGFKLFYKNDTLESGTVLMDPNELLELRPKPIYIQYQ